MRHEDFENTNAKLLILLAIPAGLEPATRGVEIRYSNFVQDSATDDPNDVEKFSIPLDGAEGVTVPSRAVFVITLDGGMLARLGQLKLPYKAEMLRALPEAEHPVAILSYDEKPGIQAIARRAGRGSIN